MASFMIRTAAALLSLLLLAACASDPEPSDMPADAAGGGVDVAGHVALAGAGGSPAVDVAGSAGEAVAGTGAHTSAGAGAIAGAEVVAGQSGAAAGGGGIGGSAGAVEVAGTGAAGSNVAGSTGAAGTSAPVAHELWTITQNQDIQITTVRPPSDITARLVPSDAGAMAATTLSWAWTTGEPADHTFTMIPGKTTVEAAYLACGAFQSAWAADIDGITHGDVVHAETPAHVTSVHLVASSTRIGSTEAWTLSVHLTWTAYGY